MAYVFVDVKQDKLVAEASCKGHWGEDDSPRYQNLLSLGLRHREPSWPFGRPPTSGQTRDSMCIASGKRQLYNDKEEILNTTTTGNKGQLGRLVREQRPRRD